MSIHVQLDAEAQKRLAAQRRNSSISSAIISVLVIVLIGLALGLVFLPSFEKEVPVIVSYTATTLEDNPVVNQKATKQIQRKPTSPASSSVKVISTNSSSPVSIPVPDEVSPVESVDFGDGEDFGGGWGEGDDFGSTGGASFFNQTVSADRIAYVIDYSASMRGKRDELMRKELTKSVSGLGTGTQYQMLFFAGPVWVAGDELKFDADENGKSSKSLEIKSASFKKYKLKKAGGWEVPRSYNPEWLDANISTVKKSLEHIKSTGLVYGTEWSKPLELAMEMKPAPQIIFFMTDGAGGSVGKIKKLSSEAKRKGIIINSIAMMVPSAAEAMAALAHGTGGSFTIVEKDGNSRVIEEGEKVK